MESVFLNRLFERSPRSVAYLICAALCIFLTLASIEYGGFYFYVIPVLLCIVQFAYPVAIGWWCVFTLTSCACGALWYELLRDFYLLIVGSSPHNLVDADDSVFFLTTALLLLCLVLWIYRARPQTLWSKRLKAGTERRT